MSRNSILNVVLAVIVALCLWGVARSTASEAEHVIRIGILASPEDEDYDGALVFEDFVESRSQGRIAVEIFTSGQYCANERECIENLQAGVLDVFMTTFGGFANVYGPGQVFDLPYMFADDATAECVLDGPIVDEVRKAVLAEGVGIRLMTVTNTGGWRNIATTKKPVRSPADMTGLKIRTIPAPIQQELVRRLGANPTPIAWSEIYLALATGVVEGTKNSIQDIVGMKLEEHVKFLTLDNHAYMGAMWWFSDARWRALPPDLRRIVHDGFQELKVVGRALPKRRQIEAYETFRAAGGAVYVPTAEERAQFREAASGLRAWYVENYGAEWLTRLDAAIGACEASMAAAFGAVDADAEQPD